MASPLMSQRRHHLNIFISFLVIASLLLTPVSCAVKASAEEKYEESRANLMNTFFKVTVYSDDKDLALRAIKAAYARMEETAAIASIFDPNAEAYKLNEKGYFDHPSPDLVALIRLSIEYNKITGGAFDITVQPLLDLWGNMDLKLWEKPKEVQQAMVNERMPLIGSDKINITQDRISFKVPGMKITLGGIAKGYAADEALKIIDSMGIKHALVAAGGNIGALGTKINAEPWKIALVNPDNTNDSLATFQFSGMSISTSGNYERFFSPDKKVNHIMDPRTGFSVSDVISVTIIAEDGTQADALSTSVFVLGVKDGMKLVESLHNVEVLIVDSDRKVHKSSGVDKYLLQSK
jgi:thiamine biosynthesis lipoprotein